MVRKFKAFIDAALPVAYQIIMAQLQDVALNAVKELQSTDLNNEEKRKEAFKRIKQYAVDKGINAKDSLINALLELAVLKFKVEF